MKKQEPKVSVIVPVYNTEKYLVQCIDSIIGQTYTNLEIILVDDGSTDSSGQICDEYKAKDNRVFVIHKKNGGASSAREAGVDQMSGDFGMFVDADDWIDLCTVEKSVSAAFEYSADCVLFTYMREYPERVLPVWIYPDSKVFSGREAESLHRRLFGLVGEELKAPERADSIVSCCMKLYRAALLRAGKYFDTRKIGGSEDTLFNIYALYGCQRFYYMNEPLYHYRKLPDGSLSSSYRNGFQEKWEALMLEFENALAALDLGEAHAKALQNRTALGIIGFGLNELNHTEAGWIRKTANIHSFISTDRYRTAIQQMELGYLPLKWHVFLLCAKYRCSFFVFLILQAIRYLKSKV